MSRHILQTVIPKRKGGDEDDGGHHKQGRRRINRPDGAGFPFVPLRAQKDDGSSQRIAQKTEGGDQKKISQKKHRYYSCFLENKRITSQTLVHTWKDI